MFNTAKRTFIRFGNSRFLSGRSRKFPIRPEDAEKLPVFDYGTSKQDYRRVFVWGNIQTGALGVPYIKKGTLPEQIKYFQCPKRMGFAEKFPVTNVACGFGFTAFAVDDQDSKLYGTGLNTDSQIGYHALRKDNPLQILYSPRPIDLPLKHAGSRVRKLAAGRAHLAVLTDEGLYLLGNNAYGQCGREIVDDENYFHSNFINHIANIEDKTITDIECGQDHTLAITEDGAVYSCGWGADGQTGLGFYKNCSKFRRCCGDIDGERIIKISSRSDFVLALNRNGDVFGWGNAEYGQITTMNNEQQVCTPRFLSNLKQLGRIVDVAAAGSFCVVLNDKGEVFVWGFGILGAGPRVEQSLKPIKLPETLFGQNDFQPDNKVISVGCGLNYVMAVTDSGDLFSWGRNMKCCLGLGDEKDQYFPFKVSLGGYVERVACGLDHTVAICKPFI